MQDKILITSIFIMLGIVGHILIGSTAFAKIPKQGQCHYNRNTKKNFLTIKNMENQIVVVGYTETGNIAGFASIPKEELTDKELYRLKKEACPMFRRISETTKEVVKAFGLTKDFQIAVCKSRAINKWRNIELCETLEK